jgi:guanylate kinase
MNKQLEHFPIILSSPSGGGKSTVADKVLDNCPSVVRSISFTTRLPRKGEKNKVDYCFVDVPEFKKRIAQKQFVEWAVVHGNYYGTPVSSLKANLKRGKDVLLVIDPQGAKSIRKIFPSGVFIFLIPPRWSELVSRLIKRGSEQKKSLNIRIANAR